MAQGIEDIKINIKEKSSVPKYIQVADSISNDIEKGKIKSGQKLPSINELSDSNSLSRDTIEKAYKTLRENNLIFSVMGVGFFAMKKESKSNIDIFFLINKPSSYKMEVYDAFVNTMGNKARVDLYLYYFDEDLFVNALKKNINNFNYFVVMPHFKSKGKLYINHTPKVLKAIGTIPKEKLIVLDNPYLEISGKFIGIYQNYKEDIIHALTQAVEKLKNYSKIILVCPTRAVFPYPEGIFEGFMEFCRQNNFKFEVLDEIYNDLEFESKEAYITVEEDDLVKLVQQIKDKNLVMGKDVGVISYNDTHLKALLGITVISTDFKEMGKTAAELVLNNEKKIVRNPFNYIERSSL